MDATERLKNIATIFATIAVPVILAVGGWLIQDRLANQGLQKEYVQIALSVLKEAPEQGAESRELRAWAVQIIDLYAPVPLSKAAKRELLQKKLLGFSEWELSQIAAGENCTRLLAFSDDRVAYDACMQRRRERFGENAPP